MHGFSWVRIDRTIDRTAPLKKLAKACGKDEVWALGLVVRTKLTYATRFPAGVANLSADDLALELDVEEHAIAQLMAQGYLQQLEDGLLFVGWQDDPAVRDLVNRRQRAIGSKPADERQAVGRLPAGSGQAVGRLPAGSGQAAGHTIHDMTGHDGTGQNMTVQDMTDLPMPQAQSAGEVGLHHKELAHVILQRWPADRRCNPRQVIWAIRADQLQPDMATCTRIANAASSWVQAYEQQGRSQYLPRLDNWISSGAWREEPPKHDKEDTAGLSEDDWAGLLDAAAKIDATLKNERIN